MTKIHVGGSSTLIGGQVISEELGIKLENVTINDLGSCKKLELIKKIPLLLVEAEAPLMLVLDVSKI